MSALASFFARLTPREKMVLSLAAVFGALALIDRIIIGPIVLKMKFLDERISVQRDLIKKNTRIVSEKDRVERARQEYSVYSRPAKSHEEEIAALLDEIEKLASKNSIYIVDMKPQGIVEERISRRYSIDLNCEAQMEQLIGFMFEIENTNRLLLIGTFNISPKSKDSSVAKCNLRISSVIFL